MNWRDTGRAWLRSGQPTRYTLKKAGSALCLFWSRYNAINSRNGEQNRLRGMPSPEILESVEALTLQRTERNGWIHLRTDRGELWMEMGRSYVDKNPSKAAYLVLSPTSRS